MGLVQFSVPEPGRPFVCNVAFSKTTMVFFFGLIVCI